MDNQPATLARFLNAIEIAPESELVFTADGREVSAGYHVTELKSASVNSIDCGHRTDSWQETIIQILDGSGGAKSTLMNVGKFKKIADASAKAIPELSEGALFFEYSPENGPLQKRKITNINMTVGRTEVELEGDQAICKPMFFTAQSSDQAKARCC